MPRVCNREGCGRRIVGKDDSPSYDRHLCSADCLRQDKRERVVEMRRRARIGRCKFCGRKATMDASQNGAVKLHNASLVNIGRTLDAQRPKCSIAL